MVSEAEMQGVRNQQQEVLLIPFLAQGHIFPFLELAKFIAKQMGTSYTISMVMTPGNATRIQPEIEALEGLHNIQVIQIPFDAEPFGVPSGIDNADKLSYEMVMNLIVASESLQKPFEELLGNLSEQGRRPLCVISDMFFGWTVDAAKKFNIPRIQLCTCSAFGTVVYFSLWKHLPHQVQQGETISLPDLPGVTLDRSQVPAIMKKFDGSTPLVQFMRRQITSNSRSWGTICNTFDELEPRGLELLRHLTTGECFISSIGPLVRDTLKTNRDSTELKILKWLEGKKGSSVIYVCFGSMNTISTTHMKEMALGLEASNVPFIWVVRPPLEAPSIDGEFLSEEYLPLGFEERVSTTGQGLLIRRWAPQTVILSHPSVGGFLSHCGWNSTLESIRCGVPILAWPFTADQPANSKVLEEHVGMGVELWRGKEGDLGKDRVERMVREIMVEESGRKLRVKAQEMKEYAFKSSCLGDDGVAKGKSVKNLHEMFRLIHQYRATNGAEYLHNGDNGDKA